jgi:hypothetical protein
VLTRLFASLSTHPNETLELPVAPNVFGSAIHEILRPLGVGAETQQIIFHEAANVLAAKLVEFYTHLIEELKSNNLVTETHESPSAGNGFAYADPTPRFLTEHAGDKSEQKPVAVAPQETDEVNYSQTDLADLLHRIQQGPDPIPKSTESPPSAEVPQDSAARQAESTDASPALDTALNDRIETTGKLPEILRNDKQVSEDVIPWIRSLSQPLLKASIMDPRFFHNGLHPLRKIFNQLEHLGMYIDRADQTQIASRISPIDELVEQVVKNPQENESELGEVSKQLGIIEAQRSKEFTQNVEQVVLSCEGLQRAEHAEKAVRNQLNGQLSGQQVPRVVTELLAAGWLLLLERTYIREGAEGSTWKQYLFVLERLIQRLSKPQQSQSQSGQEGLELYRVVEYAFESVSFDPFRKKTLLDSLKNLLVDESQHPRNTQPEMSDFQPLVPRGESNAQTDQDASIEPAAPERIPNGAWKEALERSQELFEGNRVEVALPDGSTRSYRLVWIGDKNSRFVFVDHRGQKALEFDLTQLATKIHYGDLTLKPETGIPLIDRLAAAMLEEAREQESHGYRDQPGQRKDGFDLIR